MKEFEELINIIKTLREPGGCAWDREQTIETLKPYLIEETYEVIEAVQNRNYEEICEELGDLLTQIVFMARIAEEQNAFTLVDVCAGICNKLIRRHPHVFGEVKTDDTREILKNWEKIKSEEKAKKRASVLDDIPKALPSLIRAIKVQKRLSRIGFDWKDHEGALEKLYEELNELEESISLKDYSKIEQEIGDLIFSVVNVARLMGIDGESALQKTVNKVDKRFRYVEERIKESGEKIEETSLEKMDEYWNEAKKNL